jgi:hypothetical protein
LEYFDGSQWHDVWGDLGVSDGANHGRPLTAAKSGKALIIDSFQESCLYLVEYLDGHAHRTQLFTRANNYRSPTIRDFVQDQKGDVWLSPQIGDFRRGNMCCVHEGAMQDAGFRAIPLLADSAGRIWARAESEPLLRVMINGHWAEAMVQGADENTRVLETADQRLWVLTGDSIVQLKADSRDAFSEVGRWRWNAPLNDFTQAFCDDGEGLWIRGQANRATRYQLPVR